MDYLLNYVKFLGLKDFVIGVLNLIINGLPSKLKTNNINVNNKKVLNLIINGLPSKRRVPSTTDLFLNIFKPYYKWITF